MEADEEEEVYSEDGEGDEDDEEPSAVEAATVKAKDAAVAAATKIQETVAPEKSAAVEDVHDED